MVHFLLLLFSSNFLLLGNFFLIGILVVLIVKKGYVRFPPDFWLLLLFALSYFLIDWIQNQSVAVSALLCPVAYLVGANLDQSNGMKDIKNMLLFLALGMVLHGLLNFIYETIRFGGINYSALHYDIWSGSISAVTAQMTNYVLILCFAGCSFLFLRRYWWLILLELICLAHSLLCGSRTYVVLLGISVGISFVVYLWSQRGKRLRSMLMILLTAGLFIWLIWIAYQNNLFGIRSFWESTYLYHRLFSDYAVDNGDTLFSTGRWTTKLRYLQMLPKYLMGGMHVQQVTGWYAHDIWLDTADRVGIFPFFLLLIYTVRLGIRIVQLVNKNELNLENKIIFLCSIVLVMIQFLLEPILSGSPILFHSVCILDGMISVYMLQQEQNQSELKKANVPSFLSNRSSRIKV